MSLSNGQYSITSATGGTQTVVFDYKDSTGATTTITLPGARLNSLPALQAQISGVCNSIEQKIVAANGLVVAAAITSAIGTTTTA